MKNFLNRWFNPTHSLFILYQLYKKFVFRKFFRTFEENPLTSRQIEAIILDERRNLLIAGAGTGKTSTLLGKIGYLIKNKTCKGDQILALAYNKSAAVEIEERLADKLGVNITTSTFHGLGMKILQDSGEETRVSNFVNQPILFQKFITNVIENKILKDKKLLEKYLKFFLEFEYSVGDETRDFETFEESAAWHRSNPLRTLKRHKETNKGEIVKSYGELLIANFLYRNGIPYQYEPHYKSLTPLKGYYRPDFGIEDRDIYIEFFGIDKNNKTAKFIDNEKYLKQMEWKKNLHKRNRTILISLYHHQVIDKSLLDNLRAQLRRHKVAFSPIDNQTLIKDIKVSERDKKFIELIVSFLNQFKENAAKMSFEKIREKSRGDTRAEIFLDIFSVILEDYEDYLRKNEFLDFPDMISKAAQIVEEKKFLSPWKRVLVDEFQDISSGRFSLLESILNQNSETNLCCVGDDWQSIYRFSGSNNKIITKFEDYFGRHTALSLDTTFRFNNKISEVSEKFITQNPNQLKKNLKTLYKKQLPQVVIQYASGDDLLSEVLKSIMDIQSSNDTTGKTLLLLSRYNYSKRPIFESEQGLEKLEDTWNGTILNPLTIHKSKGLESDYVILLDLHSNGNGFPSIRENDKVLELILPEKDIFKHSEERRLMYVALTRARSQCYIIASDHAKSVFATELCSGSYDVKILSSTTVIASCPVCRTGKLVKRELKSEIFFACENAPLCDFKPLTCPKCRKEIVLGVSIDGNATGYSECQSEKCNAEYKNCSKCDEGILTLKYGNGEGFFACHDYRRTNCSGKGDYDDLMKLMENEFSRNSRIY